MNFRQFSLVLIVLVATSLSLFSGGCKLDENPLGYIGMSAVEIRDRYGADAKIVYIQRGVPNPKTYSGEILLSSFTIRHPVTHRAHAAFVYCQVKEGVIETCTPDEVDDPSDELLKWFPGKSLDEIPVEFYVQTPPISGQSVWAPLKEFQGELQGFNGVIYLDRGRYFHFLDFKKGECVGVESEVDAD